MAMEIGHQYYVHAVKWTYGTLEECLQYIQDNKVDDPEYMWELRPIVNVKSNVTVKEYSATLLKAEKHKRKEQTNG